jgi:hypothetical protein
MIPSLAASVIYNDTPTLASDIEKEMSSLESHPVMQLDVVGSGASSDDPLIYLESTGVYDANNSDMPARALLGSAIRNLHPALKGQLPDIALHRGSKPVSDYNNPGLVPGMFPTLFPFGIGGFNDPSRRTPISLRVQTESFLDLADPAFRRHRSFTFVMLNIHQRHTAHFHCSLNVKKSAFDRVTPDLAKITPQILSSVAAHLEKEGKIADLSDAQKIVMKLLSHVDAVVSHLPGSKMNKLKIRNDIRAYVGYFGLPVLYLTLNPRAFLTVGMPSPLADAQAFRPCHQGTSPWPAPVLKRR